MTADTQTHIHRHIDNILDTQTVVTSDTQTDMASYLILKMKSDTHTGMKLETYDYHDMIYRHILDMKQIEISFVTAQ